MTDRLRGTRHGVPSDIAAPFTKPHRPDDVGGIELPRHVPVWYPELYPIPDAQEFNPSGTEATAAVETDDIVLSPTITNGVMQLPPGNVGVIRNVTFSITDMLATTDVSFSLLINGAPAPGYAGIKITPRVATYVGNSFDCLIRVPDNSILTVVFSNVDGGTYVVGASLSGWYWPEASGKRWLQSGK